MFTLNKEISKRSIFLQRNIFFKVFDIQTNYFISSDILKFKIYEKINIYPLVKTIFALIYNYSFSH